MGARIKLNDPKYRIHRGFYFPLDNFGLATKGFILSSPTNIKFCLYAATVNKLDKLLITLYSSSISSENKRLVKVKTTLDAMTCVFTFCHYPSTDIKIKGKSIVNIASVRGALVTAQLSKSTIEATVESCDNHV